MKPTLISLSLLIIAATHHACAQQIKSTSYTMPTAPPNKVRADSTASTAGNDSCKAVYNYMRSRPLQRNSSTTVDPPTGAKSYYLKSGVLYSEDN